MLRTDELMRTLSRADGMEELSGYSFFPTAEANCTAFLQSMLAGRGMTPATLIERSLISRPYVYQMISGERLPGRDIALRIAFSLALTLEETQQLLRAAQRGGLYPKVYRDACLIHCLNAGMSLADANEYLQAHGQEPLL